MTLTNFMYEVMIQRKFDASHALRGCRGCCEKPHPHTWRCEVILSRPVIDETGCAVDFHVVGAALDKILSLFTDSNLNETAPFTNESPSAENIARYIYSALAKTLNHRDCRVTRVNIWEDDDHGTSYFEAK